MDFALKEGECEVCGVLKGEGVDRLQADKVYKIPSRECGIRIRAASGGGGDMLRFTYKWLREWPFFKANLPREMTGREMARLLIREGLELIKMVEIELVEGDERYRPVELI